MLKEKFTTLKVNDLNINAMISIGLEDAEDLIEDLQQAFIACGLVDEK